MERDAARMQAIEGYDILNGPPRSDLTGIAELAALIAGAPMAVVNIITLTEQVQIATYGFEPATSSRSDSMCAQVFEQGVPTALPDASLDERFADNAWVNGQLAEVRFYASMPLITPHGVPVGSLCVFGPEAQEISKQQLGALEILASRVVDAMELGLAVNSLRGAQQRLLDSNRQLAAFASQVSHDLKTPLTGMSLSLELLREQFEEPGDVSSVEVTALLDRSVSGLARMAASIDRNLAFVTSSTDTTPVLLDLDKVVSHVIADLHYAVRDSGGIVAVHDSLPSVWADEVQLRAVLQNLIHNALKYGGTKGAAPRVCVSASTEGSAVRVEIADSGPGLGEVNPEELFKLRTRGSTVVEGIGIGLYTSRKFVEAHDGRIGLENRAVGGALAWFELPLR